MNTTKDATMSSMNKNVTLTVRVEPHIKKIFDYYCNKEGRQQKWVASKALERFFNEEGYITIK